MGLAYDTVLVAATNPGAGPTVGTTTASGDSLAVRNFNPATQAFLENIIRQGATLGFTQVRSPLLHDNVRGIRVTPFESPSVFSIPGPLAQRLYAQDNLIVEMSGGAAEVDIAALSIYYQDLPGVSARLHSWGDIVGNIVQVKPISVAVTSSATPGAWQDTPLTTSENLLQANTDYAVLGYMSNAALGVIGFKGTDTGNLRICGPGSTSELVTTNQFVYLSQQRGQAYIPVFNAANANNSFVSVAASAASVAATVELICAKLSPNLTS